MDFRIVAVGNEPENTATKVTKTFHNLRETSEMLKRISATLAIGLGLLCMLCLPAASNAQSVHGSIVGNVTDDTGAAIPGATVTVTDEQKGTVVTVQSNAEGEYEVHELIPDTYDIKIAYQGFGNF